MKNHKRERSVPMYMCPLCLSEITCSSGNLAKKEDVMSHGLSKAHFETRRLARLQAKTTCKIAEHTLPVL